MAFPKSKEIFTPDGSRPINLFNSRTKLCDKMINTRLIYTLEKSRSFDKAQFGFRQNRTTIDSLIHLDHYIRSAINKKNPKKNTHVDLVSFDIKKAFDSVWPEAVLMKLDEVSIGGKMIDYIKNFLSERRFVVVSNGVCSEVKTVDLGVPQGSPLSSTMFIIAFQHLLDAAKNLDNSIGFSAYADDLIIYSNERSNKSNKKLIQSTIKCLTSVGDKFGLKFAKEKTKCIHICRKKNLSIMLEM